LGGGGEEEDETRVEKVGRGDETIEFIKRANETRAVWRVEYVVRVTLD
jgi:hypothetical protein